MTLTEDLKNKKPIIGTKLTFKKLKRNEIKKIYIASNCTQKERLLRYSKMFNIDIIQLKENNKEIGGICKKPFSISVVSFE